ncbi:S9 family peptidase [Smaragdicoccus niigatensis]|uniref:S9 family peptidase n=1 Tax=Smaragdicoccus niigatensis TaxID=359359 RepID=UPI0003734EB9|nr:S9 family peptidase [Smaragdicoccus niigatensis]
MQPPVAKRVPVERSHHGDTFVDEYEWLRDKESPEVIAYLEAENAYTEAMLADQAQLREDIFNEIKLRTKETDLTVPVRIGQYWYYSRTIEGQQYARHCRCSIASDDDWTPPKLDAEEATAGEEVVLDSNVLAEGQPYFSLGAFSVSADGRMLAFSTDIKGDERYTLRFKDLNSGEILADHIEDIAPGATWAADDLHVFYETVDESWRPDSVWRHRLGTPKDQDVRVFHEPDERFWVSITATRSEKYLMIFAHTKVTSEGWILESDDPTGDFRVILPRREGIEYSAVHAVIGGVDSLVITHNENAENFEVVVAPVDDPTNRRTVIEHRLDTRIEGVSAFRGHLALSYRREALPRVGIMRLTENGIGELSEIDFGLELFTAGVSLNPEWTQPRLRVSVTSFITPARVYDYDVITGDLVLLKEQSVLGGFSSDDYVERRDWATAEDGTRVPISIVARKGTPHPAPTLLYGYGSYESSIDPYFSVPRLSMLDRGMVFVVAHIRGGGEIGRHWYDNGKMLAKKNTFTDFVACGRHLIDSGVASRLVASGGSAGGLLMGAVANLAPDLFAGIVADVPFVDPLTTILDPSLPLTVIEWDEWGNPLADPEVYAYMKSYSPYENVEAKDYPAILVLTSLNDTRVLYVEPAKWIARLRALSTGDKPILLKTEMSAGHGGVSGRYDQWKDVAFEFAWIIRTAGAQSAD